MADFGGFDHNAQTLRMLTRLEQRYPGFAGLNLSWETLEGLAKHNGPVAAPSWALASIDAEYPLALDQFPGLEAQVAALADDIAYDNHDIDDGLRAGLFDRNSLFQIPHIEAIWERVRDRFPDARETQLNSEIIREQIGLMVSDLLEETGQRVADAEVRSVADIRQADRPLAGFSMAMTEHEKLLKAFLQTHMYSHSEVTAVAEQARDVVAALFASFSETPANLPESWQQSLPADQPERARHIADFIAGMTDSYALRSYYSLFGKDENSLILSLMS
jgi:dGTPase